MRFALFLRLSFLIMSIFSQLARLTLSRILRWYPKRTFLKRLLTLYPDADKSFARPGRKQARKHVRDARDFNNIETRAVIKFFFFLQGKVPKEIHAILTETLA